MSALFGMRPEQIKERKSERYESAKEGLKNSDHYPRYLKKELKRMVDEYEKEYPISQPSTKPKYIGIPDAESCWLLRD